MKRRYKRQKILCKNGQKPRGPDCINPEEQEMGGRTPNSKRKKMRHRVGESSHPDLISKGEGEKK